MTERASERPPLVEAAEITAEIRRLQDEIVRLGARRRILIRALWRDEWMTQKDIAAALGLSGQTVWNEIHRDSVSLEMTETAGNGAT